MKLTFCGSSTYKSRETHTQTAKCWTAVAHAGVSFLRDSVGSKHRRCLVCRVCADSLHCHSSIKQQGNYLKATIGTNISCTVWKQCSHLHILQIFIAEIISISIQDFVTRGCASCIAMPLNNRKWTFCALISFNATITLIVCDKASIAVLIHNTAAKTL